MTRPFRFGVQAGGLHTADEFIAVARKAEELGYAALAIPDHLDDQFAPLIALAAAAQATSTIELQTLVLANDYRHPAVLAKEIATLDVLSGGRVILGIGAGWMQTDYDQAGLDYDRPGLRIERLAESITVLKGLLGGEPVDFAGDHYRITGMTGTPAPARQPHVPLMIAGGGKKVLTLAGREADIVGVNPGLAAGVVDERIGATATAASTDDKIAWIRDAAGDRFADIELQTTVFMPVITDDPDGVAAMIAPGIGATADDVINSPHALIGTVAGCRERIESWRERWGISFVSVRADAMEALAPLVADLTGT